QDPVATTDQLNEFYRAAGVEKNYRADVVTSVKALLGRPVTMAEMEQAMREGFAQLFALENGSITEAERQRAQELVPQRRLDRPAAAPPACGPAPSASSPSPSSPSPSPPSASSHRHRRVGIRAGGIP